MVDGLLGIGWAATMWGGVHLVQRGVEDAEWMVTNVVVGSFLLGAAIMTAVAVLALSLLPNPSLPTLGGLVLATLVTVGVVLNLALTYAESSPPPPPQYAVSDTLLGGPQRITPPSAPVGTIATGGEREKTKTQAKKTEGKGGKRGEMAVVVVGVESSGSRLAAQTLAAALGVRRGWDGYEDVGNGVFHVYHRSLPHGPRDPGNLGPFPDIPGMVSLLEERFDKVKIVLTTRDAHVEQCSKLNVHNGGHPGTNIQEMKQAQAVVRDLMVRNYVDVLWSYEALMFIGKPYVMSLYASLGIVSDYMPPLADANHKYVRPCVDAKTKNVVPFFDHTDSPS